VNKQFYVRQIAPVARWFRMNGVPSQAPKSGDIPLPAYPRKTTSLPSKQLIVSGAVADSLNRVVASVGRRVSPAPVSAVEIRFCCHCRGPRPGDLEKRKDAVSLYRC